jgi:hypothetical protein
VINLSHIISSLNFVFTIVFYAMRWIKQDHTCIYFKRFLNKNHLSQIFNLQQPKNPYIFLFPFFALIRQYLFSYFLVFILLFFGSSHSFTHIFFTDLVNSSVKPLIRPTGPISFSHLWPTAVAFDLPGRRAILHCVIHLWHRGAASPPPPLSLWKWPRSITSPSSYPSHVTGVIEVPLLLSSSPWPPAFHCPTALWKTQWEHLHYPAHPPRLQFLLLAPGTISLSEHHRPPLLSAIVWPSLQLRLQVTSLVRTPMTSTLSLSLWAITMTSRAPDRPHRSMVVSPPWIERQSWSGDP